MYSIKSMLSLLTLLLFNLSLFAQTSFLYEPENLNEVMQHIEEAYGSQIEIDLNEIYNFLDEAINDSNYSENCLTPEVSITEYEVNHLGFSWEAPLDDVLFFEHRVLNLYTGESEYGTTQEGYAEYDASSGFYLFMFNSACSEERVSKANIIIVDKDVMLNGPPELQNCDCKKPVQVGLIKTPTLSSSTWPILGYAQINWPASPYCSVTKYIIDIDDMAAGSYEASAFFVHQTNTSPNNVFIHPNCSYNMTATPGSTLQPGDPGKYHLEFNSNIRVNIEDASIMANGSIFLTTCKCRGVKKRTEEKAEEQKFENLVLNYQNPVHNNLSLDINLPQSGNINIRLFDLLGKSVGQKLSSDQESGTHHINVPMSHLPSGIYNCIIEYNNQIETIKVVKI